MPNFHIFLVLSYLSDRIDHFNLRVTITNCCTKKVRNLNYWTSGSLSVLYTTVLQDFRTLESDMEYYSLKEYVTLSGRSQDSRVKTVIKLTDPKYNNFWAVDHKTMALIVKLKRNDVPVLEAYPSRSFGPILNWGAIWMVPIIANKNI